MKVRRGRPLGEIAQRMLLRIESGPVTMPQLAGELQVGYRVAEVTVRRLVASGHAQWGSAVPGAHLRPARMVEPARQAPQQPADPFAQLHAALVGKR